MRVFTKESEYQSCLIIIITNSILVDKQNKKKLEMRYRLQPDDIVPVVHYSESRSEEQLDESIKPQASDLIKKLPDTYGHNVDIMVEKHKELKIEGFIK